MSTQKVETCCVTRLKSCNAFLSSMCRYLVSAFAFAHFNICPRIGVLDSTGQEANRQAVIWREEGTTKHKIIVKLLDTRTKGTRHEDNKVSIQVKVR